MFKPLLISAFLLTGAHTALADTATTYDFTGFNELDIAAGVEVNFTTAPDYSIVDSMRQAFVDVLNSNGLLPEGASVDVFFVDQDLVRVDVGEDGVGADGIAFGLIFGDERTETLPLNFDLGVPDFELEPLPNAKYVHVGSAFGPQNQLGADPRVRIMTPPMSALPGFASVVPVQARPLPANATIDGMVIARATPCLPP